MIRLDYKDVLKFVTKEEIAAMEPVAIAAKAILLEGSGAGSEFRGWIDLPESYDKEEYERIKKAAAKIHSDSDILVVIGIGGSYLGARAAIEALTHSFNTALPKGVRKYPRVIFCGNNISTKYMKDLADLLTDVDWSINVISKSGTTTEPAIAFRYFKQLIEEKYGKAEAAKRIYATTDKAKGALKQLSEKEGYEQFVVPDDVGGRYSVLTAVGLLPIAAAGIDIDALMAGARAARGAAFDKEYMENDALLYAAVRHLLTAKDKYVETIADYEPSLHYVLEWWKQLYGESLGKDGKGLYPASADYTTDLHSFGQYIQDAPRIMFETVLSVENHDEEIIIKEDADNLDQLNYLAGKTVEFANHAAMEGTILAHVEGGVPNIRIKLDKQDAYNLGELFYMFEFSCGVDGYMLEVNPFNQPGVESYKKNMFALLGKPGYEGVLEGR